MARPKGALRVTFVSPGGLRVSLPLLRTLRSVVRKIGAQEKSSGAIQIMWTDDAAMRLLNKTYRHLDKTTDVLSFLMNEDGVVGDIVISVEKAKRQAPRFHNTPSRELIRLAVHGVYHLLGYDHHRTREAVQMRAREKWAMAHARGGA